VISPEGCASILWRDSTKAEQAANALRITAADLSEMGIIDEVVAEPEGGAHMDHEAAAQFLDPVLFRSLEDLSDLSVPELLQRRYEKFRRMGQFLVAAPA
jgi:acetyl-CoA carboxylase alpha subunit